MIGLSLFAALVGIAWIVFALTVFMVSAVIYKITKNKRKRKIYNDRIQNNREQTLKTMYTFNYYTKK